MNKEEILNKARKERNEEFEKSISHEAITKAGIGLSVLCIVIFIIKVVMSDIKGLEQVIPFYDTIAVLFGYTAVLYFSTYRRIQQKKYLLISGSALLIFAFCMYKFVTTL